MILLSLLDAVCLKDPNEINESNVMLCDVLDFLSQMSSWFVVSVDFYVCAKWRIHLVCGVWPSITGIQSKKIIYFGDGGWMGGGNGNQEAR